MVSIFTTGILQQLLAVPLSVSSSIMHFIQNAVCWPVPERQKGTRCVVLSLQCWPFGFLGFFPLPSNLLPEVLLGPVPFFPQSQHIITCSVLPWLIYISNRIHATFENLSHIVGQVLQEQQAISSTCEMSCLSYMSWLLRWFFLTCMWSCYS